MTGPTVSSLVNELHRAYPAGFALNLAFGRFRIQLLSNHDGLIRELKEYFGPFVSLKPDFEPVMVVTAHQGEPPLTDLAFETRPPDPGKTKIKEEFVDLPDGRIVRKRLTGMVFAFGGDLHAAVGPCLDNPNQVVNFINNRHIDWMLNQGGILGHAAGVAAHGRGLALAGFSGAGKSTLALHLMSRGTSFVSNDRLVVQAGEPMTMHGVAKLPRINPGTIMGNPDLAGMLTETERGIYEAMVPDELWSLEAKHDAFLDQCFGPGRFCLEAPMDGLAILNWKRGQGKCRVEVVDLDARRDLLPAFMKSPGLFFLPRPGINREPGPEVYVRALAGSLVLEFSGGVDFILAADTCLNFLRHGRPGVAA
ncbi:MAG: HprK-related kinase B [Deltaproteobacteria bacterium]|nr:HprK-related kinase B [Deltaproteobacteria bacterium]